MNGKRSLVSSGLKLTVALKGRSNVILESGALIRANNGHCSLDDIDRLNTYHNSLINVLQTQTITLPFPAVYSSINLESNIIATANTARSHYDPRKCWTDNVRIPRPLLSQFHLVFVMLDKPNKSSDLMFPEHVKAVHAGYKKSSTIADKFHSKPKFNVTMYESIYEDNSDQEQVRHIDLEKRLTMEISGDQDTDLDLLPPLVIKQFIGKFLKRNQICSK